MNNKAINNGLLAGVVGIIILLVSYFIDQTFYMKYAGYVVYAAYLYFMYLSVKQTRDESDGFISFGKALGPAFLTFVIASLLVAIFQYVMYNFIDTSLLDAMYDQAVQQIERMGGLIGEEGTEIALERLEEDGVNYGIGTVLIGYGFGLIIPGFIFALIIAAILKKNNPSGV
jgi:hypothetical protein